MADGFIDLEIDLLVFHRFPEPFDKHVFAPGALTVHADLDLLGQQVYTPLWVDGMIAGRGWIAIALVVFGTWLDG
jgi:hypothetical protein